MSKPMILVAIEELTDTDTQYVREVTTLDDGQITALFDEAQLLKDGPGGTRGTAVERGRIFAGMSGVEDMPNYYMVASVISDMLHWLASEGTEGDVGKAVLYGCGEYQAARQ